MPRLGERGKVVAYEERVKGGAVLRDLNGKRIGTATRTCAAAAPTPVTRDSPSSSGRARPSASRSRK